MARQGMLEVVEGMVDKIEGGGFYRVTLEGKEGEKGPQVLLQLSGKLKRFRIKVLAGDRVKVELGASDPTRGFITFRLG